MSSIGLWFSAHYAFFKDFAGPIATIMAAGAAVFVTWRLGKNQVTVGQQQANTAALQAELADVRLQHDLYDRRYKLYESTKTFVLRVCRERAVDTESIFTFVRDTGDAVFLLDADMVNYIDEIRVRANRLDFLRSVINLPEYYERRATLIEEEGQLFLWFVDQFDVLRDKFKPFLVLDKRDFRHLPPPT
jgi:hypothetical protein